MKMGPRASPSFSPAAIRRLSRFPAVSSRSCPVGIATSRLARCRSAQKPPVTWAGPDATGRSRQVAELVGAAGAAWDVGAGPACALASVEVVIDSPEERGVRALDGPVNPLRNPRTLHDKACWPCLCIWVLH